MDHDLNNKYEYDEKTRNNYESYEQPVYKYRYNPLNQRPVVTYLLITINVLMWILTEYYGKKYGVNANLKFGAKFNPLIMSGEYWRLITPMFLHGGVLHLAFNSYFLYSVGPFVEKIFGKRKFITIYFIAGITGNVASFAFSQSLSVGASGALFGLMGALLYVIKKDKRIMKSSFGTNVLMTIGINLVLGFVNKDQIDNFAHIGGLIGGYLTARKCGLLWERRPVREQIIAILLIIGCIFGGVYYGFTKPENIQFKNEYEISVKSDIIINAALDSFNTRDFVEAEKLSRELLALGKDNDKIRIIALDILASSLVNQGRGMDAVEYAEELVRLEPVRGHYVLGLSYYLSGDIEAAKAELIEAIELNPQNTHAKEILDEINQ